MHRTPLALLNLIHDRKKFLTSLAGVAFAVLLMFLFNGFKNALYDSQTQLLEKFNAEIVIINRLKENMFVPRAFARRRLYQAKAFAGVEEAFAVYTSEARWKNAATKQTLPVRVIAYNPAEPVLPTADILAHQAALKLPNTALIDTRARAEVGPRETGMITELANFGEFALVADLAWVNLGLCRRATAMLMSDHCNFCGFCAFRGKK